jgi:hypothetical protein
VYQAIIPYLAARRAQKHVCMFVCTALNATIETKTKKLTVCWETLEVDERLDRRVGRLSDVRIRNRADGTRHGCVLVLARRIFAAMQTNVNHEFFGVVFIIAMYTHTKTKNRNSLCRFLGRG